MRKLRLLLRYELNFWFNKLNVHAKDGKSAFRKLFLCFFLKSELVLSLWLRSLCFKYFCKRERVQVPVQGLLSHNFLSQETLPPLMFTGEYCLLAIYCLWWPCNGLHVAMNYWKCISNFVSSWLANWAGQSWRVLKSRYTGGVHNNDFSAVSQTDLTRVQFHLWCRLLYPCENGI